MTAQARIFGTVISTYTRVVEIACEEAGVSHETVPTAARSPENRHPFGKIPVVEIDGLELIESVAIANYIDNAHNGGALQPVAAAARAISDKWVAIANNYLFPMFENGLVMPWIMHRYAGFPLDRERIERSLPDISRALGFVEAALSEKGAWTANGFCMADVFLYPGMRGLQMTIANCVRRSLQHGGKANRDGLGVFSKRRQP